MSNPYQPPTSTDFNPPAESAESTSEYRWSRTPNCPFCNASVSRFSIWNSLGLKKCPSCGAHLWLQLPPAARMLFFPAALLTTPLVIFLLRSGVTWFWMIIPAVLAVVITTQLLWGLVAGVAQPLNQPGEK